MGKKVLYLILGMSGMLALSKSRPLKSARIPEHPKNKLCYIVFLILLISIFSIEIIYSETSGIGGTAATGETGTAGTGDASQQEARVPGVTKNFYVTYAGEGSTGEGNSQTGISTLISNGGTVTFYNKGQDGKLGEPISKIENFNGKMEFRNSELYQIENKGKEKTFTVLVGKDGKQTIDVPGDGSKVTHEPGKPWQAVVRSNDNTGKPIDIKAPSYEKKEGSKESSDPVQYISDRPLKIQYGDGKSLIALPQGLTPQTKVEYKDFGDGKYNPNLQTGKYTLGDDPTKKGFELSNIDSKNNPGSILVNDPKQIPNGYDGNAIVLKQSAEGNSFRIQNTNDKIGYQATISGKNAVFPTMTDKDYVHVLPGGKSSATLNDVNGLIKTSIDGDAQIKVDDKTVVKSNGEVNLYQGSMYMKDSSGKSIPSSGLTTPNLEINLGDKSLKMGDEKGNLLQTGGKIVLTQDGDKVQMAVVGEGEDSAKIIEQLKNHEIVAGEIPSGEEVKAPRVRENPASAENVKPPAQPAGYAAPQPPEELKISPIVTRAISGIKNPDFPKLYHQIGPKALNDFTGVKYTVLEFSNPQCGNCINAAPEVERIANANPHIKIVPIDANSNRELVQKYLRGPTYPIAVLIDQSTGEIMKTARGQEITASGTNNVLSLLNYVAAMKK